MQMFHLIVLRMINKYPVDLLKYVRYSNFS